jgi:hypothetical protein
VTISKLLAAVPFTEAVHGTWAGVDTSLLIEELRRAYAKRPSPLTVDFRQLVSWKKVGDQLTHQLHPYPAKLLPHIAHFFVNASSYHGAGDVVLDPFCGSGTVALEASVAGRTPYVADANPLALLLTRVKTTRYDPEELLATALVIRKRARRYRTAPEAQIVNAHLWYTPARKLQLEVLLRAIDEVESPDLREFFHVCFSVTARRLSLSDPAISVPVRLKTKAAFDERTNRSIRDHLRWVSGADHVEDFMHACAANIQRVAETNAANVVRRAAVEFGDDARQLVNEAGCRMEPASIPLVITSPPYGSAQKYIRAMSLSLNWLRMATPAELVKLENKSIGREHLRFDLPAGTERLPSKYERFVSQLMRINPDRAAITRHFLVDLRSALHEIERVTSYGGRIVLVLGNNVVCGKPLETDKFALEVLERKGVKLEIWMHDRIKSRGLITKRHPTASVIGQESVLVLRK